MEIKILLLMLLCHIIDDFVLQPICLSKLKQKDWWEKHIYENVMYKDDYKMALFIHSMSWSIMISLPIILFIDFPDYLLFTMFVINLLIHYYIDDLKANKLSINLMADQFIHMLQIVFYWAIVLIQTNYHITFFN